MCPDLVNSATTTCFPAGYAPIAWPRSLTANLHSLYLPASGIGAEKVPADAHAGKSAAIALAATVIKVIARRRIALTTLLHVTRRRTIRFCALELYA